MRIDRQSRQLAKKIFRASLRPDGSLDEAVLRAGLARLIAEKPRHYVAIFSRLQRLVELAVEERTVRIESAAPLADQGASIIADLQARYGPAARTSYTEKPELLGGLRIQRGSQVWDGTLSTRLKNLEIILA